MSNLQRPASLSLSDTASFEEVLRMGEEVIYRSETVATEIGFMLGDIYNWFQKHHPEKMGEVAHRYGRSWYQRMADCGWIARRFPPARRFSIPFYVYREIASLPEEIQNTWIWRSLKGTEGGVTREKIRSAKKALSSQTSLSFSVSRAFCAPGQTEDERPYPASPAPPLSPPSPTPPPPATPVEQEGREPLPRLFLASAFDRADYVESVRLYAESRGFSVLSTWHAQPSPSRDIKGEAIKNIRELEISDVLLLLVEDTTTHTPLPSTTGGYYVEAGYALAKHIPICLVGNSPNIYLSLCALRVSSIEEALDTISQWRRRQ